MTACSAAVHDTNKAKGRARLTNGRDLLPTVDGRSVWARIMRDTIASMHAHLGGEQNVSEPQRMLSRRVAALEAELIHLEDGFARARSEGGAPDIADLDLYSRMSSAQRRMLEAIGLQRVPKDISSLGQILRHGHELEKDQGTVDA